MRWSDFSGGLWLTEGRDAAVPNEALLRADNVDYMLSDAVIGRRGFSEFASLTGQPRGLWRHYPRTGTPSTLVALDTAGTIHFEHASGTSATFAAVSGGGSLTTGKVPYFTNWPAKQKTYFANDTDGLRSYDGTTIAAVVGSGAVGTINPNTLGPYLIVHKSRLWATRNSELSFSIYASDVNSDSSWLSTNQLSVNDPRGGQIAGLASFFDFLLIFKSASVWRFVGDIGTLTGAQLARFSDIGCIAPNTIVPTQYGVIYLGKQGLYLTDGVSPSPVELSTPIRPLFVGRTGDGTYPNAVGTWYPKRNQYWLKLRPDVSDEGYILTRIEVLSDNAFIGERSRPVWIWSKHTDLRVGQGTTMSAWSSDADDNRLLVAEDDGKLYTMDEGSTDNGAAIVSTVQTTSRRVHEQGITGRVYRAKVKHRASVPLTCALRYDEHQADDVTFTTGSTATASERWPRTTITDFGKFGRYVSVSLSNPSDSTQFELHLIDLDVRLRSPRVWRETN